MEPPFLIKYRPTSIESMLLPPHTRKMVSMLPKCPVLSVLLLGPTGSGKTTLSSCIIASYYDGMTSTQLTDNTLVINCLRDQGVQFYRTYLKAFCQTTCTIPGKRKTVIVDDVDTISPQCQEVIRYCLDTHRARVNFISTACNRHKIQEAIRSRSITVKVPAPQQQDLRQLASRIIESEQLVMDADAVDSLMKFSGPSFRLMINYLEKFVLLSTPVTVETLKVACTNIHTGMCEHYIDLALVKRDFPAAVASVLDLYGDGYSVMDILDGLFAYLKNDTALPDAIKYPAIALVCKYTAAYALLHEHEVELVFLTAGLCRVITENRVAATQATMPSICSAGGQQAIDASH
jgi:DNA polymerase III delta prime subunit